MREILRTNDPVELGWAQAVLAGHGIAALVFDENASFVEGSIPALQRRLMVADDDADAAEALLRAARADLPRPE